MTNRREFLRHLTLLSSGLVTSNSVFRGARAGSLASAGDGRRILVVVELEGGCDGLNTVIPYRNDHYYKARPTLGIPENQGLLKLNDEAGLHPSMGGFKQLWDDGDLSIIQGVGYPDQNRSHFLSRRVWHTAQVSQQPAKGWLATCLGSESHCPRRGMHVGCRVPHAFNGDEGTATSVSSCQPPEGRGGYQSSAGYPATAFGSHLRIIAQTIAGGVGMNVFCTTVDGFDTHANQVEAGNRLAGPHATLLQDVSEGLKAFHDDLREMGRADEVLVMTFSEFGRSLQENPSSGTDHGTANQMFLIGGSSNPGLFGTAPSLKPDELDASGDMVYKVDFRSVYARVISDWLRCDTEAVLGSSWADRALDGIFG